MPGVLPMDNPGRFGAWANGPINDPAASTAPSPSASSAPTSGNTLSSPFGNGVDSGGAMTSPSSGGGNYQSGNTLSSPYGNVNSFGGAGLAPQWSDMPFPESTGGGGNGGSYGVGGQGPGGKTTGGAFSFDEGGVIDPEDDSDSDDQLPDGNTQAGDPMSVIQNALGWGRQQMGLPANFFGDQPQATPVGDVVGKPGDWPGSGIAGAAGQLNNQYSAQQPGVLDPTNVIPMPDMNKRLQDTVGKGYADGGVIPEQPQDNQQTPQSGNGAQLPDPRKTMAYLAGAGNMPPDAAMALEQRVDPQGQMDPAERKLSAITAAGNPQAQFSLMQHYRTRFNAHSAAAQAAMDQGNMALAAQHATEAMSNVPNGHSVKFAPAKGGLAMQSTPIGQKQQGMDDGGVVKKPPNPEDKWWDPDYLEKVVGGTPYPAPKDDGKTKGYAEGGAVDADNPAVMMRSYDDGGEVDSDEDQGVIPTSTEPGPSDDTENPSLATAEAPTPVAAPAAKSLLQRGWDWLVENSVGKALQGGTDETSAPPQTPQAQSPAQPAAPAAPAAPGSDQTGARQQANAIFGAANMGAGSQTPRPTPGYKGTPQEPPSNTFASQYQPRQGDPFAEEFQNLRQQARAMGLSAGPAYQKFMMEGLKEIRGNAAKLEQTKALGGIRQDIVNTQQQHGDARNALTNSTRANNAALTVNGRLVNAQMQTPLRLMQIEANSPGADLKELAKRAAPIAAQLGATPQSLIQQLQQQPMQQQRSQQAPATDNQPKKMFNGKAYTKDEWNALQQQGQ